MRRTLSIYAGYFAQSLKARMAYKADFFSEILASMLGTMAGLLFIVLLFHRVPDLGGWSREEVFFIYGLSLIPFGLYNILSINLYEFPERYIIEGRFDRLLLRPMPTPGAAPHGKDPLDCHPGSGAGDRYHHLGKLVTEPDLDLVGCGLAPCGSDLRRRHLSVHFHHAVQPQLFHRGPHRFWPAGLESHPVRPLAPPHLRSLAESASHLGGAVCLRLVFSGHPLPPQGRVSYAVLCNPGSWQQSLPVSAYWSGAPVFTATEVPAVEESNRRPCLPATVASRRGIAIPDLASLDQR